MRLSDRVVGVAEYIAVPIFVGWCSPVLMPDAWVELPLPAKLLIKSVGWCR